MAFSFSRFLKLFLKPGTLSSDEAGSLEVNDIDNKLNYHNGSGRSPVVTESSTAPLINKTIDADVNTIINIDNNDIKAGAGIDYSKLDLIDSIVNADINTAAAIARSKIASGSPNHVITNDGSGNLNSEATLSPLRGGTGISNDPASTLTFSNTNPIIVGTTGPTNITLPTSGTLVPKEDAVFTNRINIPEIASPSTPPSGFLSLYAKSDGKFYFKNDTGAETQVNAGIGGINYINANPDAESGTTGWATYADAASSRPVDGTGGSPNITLTASAVNPLRGLQSFLITKDAANRQGQGVSFDFTVDRADMAKVLAIEFDYEPGSGFTAGSDSTDSDLIAYIYDVTNGSLIEPTPFKLLTGAGYEGKFASTFQTNSNSTNYRLILHIATTSTTAWTFKFDNVSVGPQEIIEAVPVTDWRAYTPTFSQWGTVTNINFFYRRVGDSVQVLGSFTAGTPAGGAAAVSLPAGLSIDTSKLPPNTLGMIGTAVNTTSGLENLYDQENAYVVHTDISSSLTDTFYAFQSSGGALLDNGPLGAGTNVVWQFTVPVLGWSTPILLSADQDNRVVAAVLVKTSTQLISVGTPIKLTFPTATTGFSYDTHNAWDATNNRYVFPVAGKYKVTFAARYSVSSNGSHASFFFRYNGITDTQFLLRTINSAGSQTWAGTASYEFNARAGDFVEAYITNDSVTVTIDADAAFQVHKISGNSFIVPSEAVVARYQLSSTSTFNNAPVNFDTKVFDTHNAVTTGSSWKFTAPIAGIYRVGMSSATTVAVNNNIKVHKNNSPEAQVLSNNTTNLENGSVLVKLVAGDFIDLRPNGSTNFAGGSPESATAVYIERLNSN